ncbi:hypothetical protein ACQKMI_10460 [Lysinibacillus sp. NPDC097214]|uniref:hypothetical protein n=1 Tax=Lysinibacillus sp. NPDC097214 TaxID=3390584 RepID=UPI003D033381
MKKELNVYKSDLLKNREVEVTMNYIIRFANENDLSGLCDIRNNKDLFTNYLKQFAREVYLVIAEQDSLIFGFGVLKLKGTFK